MLLAFANALFRAELRGVERRHDVDAVTPSASHFAVNAGTNVEPRGGNDHGVDERTLDAVEHGRLVPLVDDAHRHEQHAGAHVERASDQEIEIRLLDLELTALLEALDDGVLDFDFADEPEPRVELVRDEQDEAVEVERAVPKLWLVEVELHVARQRRRRGGRGIPGLGLPGPGRLDEGETRQSGP